MAFRLLADESTLPRLIASCRRLLPDFPILHIVSWEDGIWLGLDDTALLICCAEVNLVGVAFDRATPAWQTGQLLRAGHDHAGLILFRGNIHSADYGCQSHLLTSSWQQDGRSWDWQNRIVHLPESPP
jgi:hypothetical protein